MLNISSSVEIDVPCIVEIDPYVPVAFKTYPEVLPGARYFRIGNFRTSLLEIGIDPTSLVIRNICLVSLDRVCEWEKLSTLNMVEKTVGLPVVDGASFIGDRVDENQSFCVCLKDDSFIIDWSDSERLSSIVRFQRISFCLTGDSLRRIIIHDLSESETILLSEHLIQSTVGID
jgi:hypothetical protein